MISGIDHFIIGMYLLFVLGVGFAFRRMSKNSSDYFRCGGAMPWWITGTSAWIAGFSAWSFTAAAGKVYETGLLVLCLYYVGIVGLLLVWWWTSVRFRRLRVITWMEAVRQRYGNGTEQFYTWLKLPIMLLFSGVGLNAIGVFMSAVFRIDMTVLLIVLGLLVTLVAFAGGAWAVLASDFVQMFLVVTITIVAAVLTLAQPEIGGLSGLIEKVPVAHFSWSALARPELITLWVIALLWHGTVNVNTFEGSSMYLMAKSDRDAKRMVLIPLIGTLISPLIWFIPSMAATITHPDLAAQFPTLAQPHEAAFIAVCGDVMPMGMIGLLLCAMLGATLTSMDAGLNKNVGVFVRSFYQPILKPQASEKHLLRVGKIATIGFGIIIVAIAVAVSKWRTMGLFDLTNQLAASLGAPLAVPLFWGMMYKKTPAWSAWTTVVLGMFVGWLAPTLITPEVVQGWFGWTTALNKREATDLTYVCTTLSVASVGTVWFFSTSWFWASSPQAHRDRVEALFTNLVTPIDAKKDGVADYDGVIYKMFGGMSLVFGVFILGLMVLPNTITGRLCFAFCGGVITLVGLILLWLHRRQARRAAALPPVLAATMAVRV